MHDVVTGFWQPNAADTAAMITAGFGASINVINGGLECSKANDKADNRESYYKSIAEYL